MCEQIFRMRNTDMAFHIVQYGASMGNVVSKTVSTSINCSLYSHDGAHIKAWGAIGPWAVGSLPHRIIRPAWLPFGTAMRLCDYVLDAVLWQTHNDSI